MLLPFFASSQIYINELLSSNSSILNDPDFDNSGDWIELFNDYNDTFDLSGHYLTDNLGDSIKWAFPAATKIAPNDFLLVWADGENTGLHSNFKLTKDGEEIGLFSPQGVLLDSIIYNNQQTDISYGRQSDGSSTWGFFTTPTPQASNTTEFAESIVFYPVRFSIKGGFYNEPISVALSAIEGNIHYTLDGSLPTVEDAFYTTPIEINETTNIRARVFLPNAIPSKPVTNSYFINEDFEARGLPVVSISANPEYFWDDEIGLYVQDFKPEWEYPINIELFENDGGNRAVINELAGTKVNGQNSWELPQKMLGIYFDNEYDQNNIDYPLFFDRARRKYDNFILRASGSDWSFTLFRDALSQHLTEGMMDLDKTGYRPTIAYVNGEYMGIHNLRSRTDESFIEENFGYASGEYDLIENNGNVEEGDSVAYEELYALFEQDLSIPANYDSLLQVLDVQNFMDFFATEIWTSNSSWGHNIKLWKPKTPNAKWRWILQDFDRGFTGSDTDGIDYFTTGSPNSSYAWARLFLRSMLENEDFAAAFLSNFADHLYTTFHPKRVSEHITKTKTAIENEIPYHVNRWSGTTSDYGDGIPTVAFWNNEVQKLYNFAEERQEFMFEELIEHFEVTETVSMSILSNAEGAGQFKINQLSIPENNWTGTYLKDLPLQLSVEAGIGYEFEGWSVSTFDTLIAKEAEWKYLDDGSNQGTTWQAPNFDDSAWASGPAQLGYGDFDENTVISFGDNDNDKHITTYFRKTFTIEDLSQYSGQILLNLLRDDGAIVYLNGEEIIRSNMPEGTIDFETQASNFVADAGEITYHQFALEASQFLEGENTLAVELHQSNGSSSDLSFDLELKAFQLDNAELITTESILPVHLQSDTIFVARFTPQGDCLLPSLITENTTLTLDCSPYLAQGDVRVAANTTLQVNPGVEVHFPDNARLIINGDLQVTGTESQPIRFLPNAAAGANTWGNITFHQSSDTSRLAWLEIVGASQGRHPIQDNAAIAAWQSKLIIDHLMIEDVEGNPILTQYSDIWLKNSRLHSKVTGDLINVKYGYGLIDNCDFRGNNQIDTDAIDYDEVENGVIRHSKIYDFFGFNSDGIDLGEESNNVLIENNFIHNITDKGISVGQQSSIVAQNNTIINCQQGFGVKDEAQVHIDHTTFYNNVYAVAAFEKNIGIGGGEVFINNSILSNSVDAPVLVDEKSIVEIQSSLSDTEPLIGDNVFFDNPMFSNPTQHDFQLQSASPVWQAATDGTNLGTLSQAFSARPDVLISAIHYHPTDNPDAEFLDLYNPSDVTIDLSGYAFVDGIAFVFPSPTAIASNESIRLVKDSSLFPEIEGQLFEWTSGSLSNSGELLLLQDAHGITVEHVLYDDALPWATAADGGGAWLSLLGADLDNHFAESWTAAGLVEVAEVAAAEVGLHVFPNPVVDDLSVVLDLETARTGKVLVYDVLGRLVVVEDWALVRGENRLLLEVTGLAAGVYGLVVFGDGGRLGGGVFVRR